MSAALPDTLTLDLPGGVPLEFRRIPAGSFRMGQRGGEPDEEPAHRVVIPEDFYLGVYPVTQAQFALWAKTPAYSDWFSHHFEEIRKSSPRGMAERYSHESPGRDRHPAVNITWWEAKGFGEWLNSNREQFGLPDPWIADLPSEAQWEYACRGNTETDFWSGDGEESLARVGWYGANAGGTTQAVGLKQDGISHEWGLSDLHGNVWEWCRDFFHRQRYQQVPDLINATPCLEPVQQNLGQTKPHLLSWAGLMRRFSEGESFFDASERSDLLALAKHGEVQIRMKSSLWKEVVRSCSNAVERGSWPSEARACAVEMSDIFQSWLNVSPRVTRGGACVDNYSDCRSAFRNFHAPGFREKHFGFRQALIRKP